MKYRNPILDELHKVKEAIAKEHEYDVDKLFESLKKHGADRVRQEARKRSRRQRKAS